MSPCSPSLVRGPHEDTYQSWGAYKKGEHISSHSWTSGKQITQHQPELKNRELERDVLAERGVVAEQPTLHDNIVSTQWTGYVEGSWAYALSQHTTQGVCVCSQRAEWRKPSWSQSLHIWNCAVGTAPSPEKPSKNSCGYSTTLRAVLQGGIRGQLGFP